MEWYLVSWRRLTSAHRRSVDVSNESGLLFDRNFFRCRRRSVLVVTCAKCSESMYSRVCDNDELSFWANFKIAEFRYSFGDRVLRLILQFD